IYAKLDQDRFQGSFEGWIKRITVNTVLQKYRKQQHLNLVSEEVEGPEEVEIDHTDVSLSTLLGYIQELPQKYRLTFNLYVLTGTATRRSVRCWGHPSAPQSQIWPGRRPF